jgi:hypothetical protein
VTARITLDRDVTPVGKGWRVTRVDGTHRMVLPRYGDGWAVFAGSSTDALRDPPLGFSGSWRQDLSDAIEWARAAS